MKIKNLIFVAGAAIMLAGAIVPATNAYATTETEVQASSDNPETLDATPIFLLSLVASLGLASFCLLQGLKTRR